MTTAKRRRALLARTPNTKPIIDQGIDNIVVNAENIEVSRRARRAKTDRLDGNKLLAMRGRWRSERTRDGRAKPDPLRDRFGDLGGCRAYFLASASLMAARSPSIHFGSILVLSHSMTGGWVAALNWASSSAVGV